MSSLEFLQFSAEPSDYLVCFQKGEANDVSCVVVEDTPGPYQQFIQDIVQDGVCSLAMTAPFSDQTLNLLQGREVTFGFGSELATVRLPNPAHCVVILDMRNGDKKATVQTFKGFKPEDFELAGFHFFKQMRGFPGKVFIATRYGRSHLEERGIAGAFGVVSLDTKADFTGMLPEKSQRDLLAALNLALIQCVPSQVYRIVNRGGNLEITMKGDICTPPASQSMVAFMEIIKAGPKGISDAELAARIGYRPRLSKKDEQVREQSEHAVSDEDDPDVAAANLLARLIHALKKGRIKGLSYADVCRELHCDIEKKQSAEVREVLLAVYAIAQKANDNFSDVKFFELLRGESDIRGEERMAVGELDSFSVCGENERSLESISLADKRRCMQNYVILHYIEIPRRQAEIEDIKAEFAKSKAAKLRGIAKDVETDNVNDEIRERKKRFASDEAEQKSQLAWLESEVNKLGKERDQYFRLGFKSYAERGGFKVPEKMSVIADYMRHLPKRAVMDIRQHCTPEPAALIEHIQVNWIRERGVHVYKGNVEWILD